VSWRIFKTALLLSPAAVAYIMFIDLQNSFGETLIDILVMIGSVAQATVYFIKSRPSNI